MDRYKDQDKSIRSGQALRARRLRSSSTTMASAVSDRRAPKQGLMELTNSIMKRADWALAFESDPVVITKPIYDQFMRYLYAAIYTLSPQGRVSGVVDMKLGQKDDLIKSGFANSSKFKSNHKWGLQPVLAVPLTCRLIKIYASVFRPLAANAHLLQNPTDPLWLTFDGEKDDSIGHKVTQNFAEDMQLHITTTIIRSLVETTIDQAFVQGRVSLEEKCAVQAVNGHTSQVVKDYYVRKDRARDVYHARSGFASALGLQMSSSSEPTVLNCVTPPTAAGALNVLPAQALAPPAPLPLPLPLPLHLGGFSPVTPDVGALPNWDTHDTLEYEDWGKDHPDYDKKVGRAKWTQTEVRFITQKCRLVLIHNPSRLNLCSRCLKAIKADRNALPIFHVFHILNSARLRVGFDLYLKAELGV